MLCQGTLSHIPAQACKLTQSHSLRWSRSGSLSSSLTSLQFHNRREAHYAKLYIICTQVCTYTMMVQIYKMKLWQERGHRSSMICNVQQFERLEWKINSTSAIGFIVAHAAGCCCNIWHTIRVPAKLYSQLFPSILNMLHSAVIYRPFLWIGIWITHAPPPHACRSLIVFVLFIFCTLFGFVLQAISEEWNVRLPCENSRKNQIL